jgi:hypothetical protein
MASSPARHHALREAAAVLLSELSARLLNLKVTERSRVIADLSMTMARLVLLERQAFGLDEDKPDASQSMTVVWEGMPALLVGDPDRRDLAPAHAVLGEHPTCAPDLGLPEKLRIVLDPAGL